MYCEDCKYRVFAEKLVSTDLFECVKNDKIGENTDENGGDDFLSYPYYEDGNFYVGPKFGCVHFEVKV